MTELVTDGLSYWARQAPRRPAIVFDGADAVDYQALDRWTSAAALFALLMRLIASTAPKRIDVNFEDASDSRPGSAFGSLI